MPYPTRPPVTGQSIDTLAVQFESVTQVPASEEVNTVQKPTNTPTVPSADLAILPVKWQFSNVTAFASLACPTKTPYTDDDGPL